MHYRIAPGVEWVEASTGPALLAWRPLRLVTVNGALAGLLQGGGDIVPSTPAATRALDALRRKGMLVRSAAPGAAARYPSVTVIVPVRDRAGPLRRCLESLRRLRYPVDRLEIVVVDDGSQDDGPAAARALGARVLPSGGRGLGPAAARNRGARAASGELLAFVDSDCVASEGWLAELVGAFEDPSVAAVGGRVDGMRTSSALDRYEAEMSSLSLGDRDQSAQAGTDGFYLPSCNLVVRRSAFAEAGGFRVALQIGEDVDLSWRLRDRGGAIAYLPRGRVLHEHRNRLAPFLRRRFDYGTSEGALDVLHPARRKRMALPPVLVAAGLLGAAAVLRAAWPPAALASAIVLVDAVAFWVRLRRRLGALPFARVLAGRLRAVGGLLYHLGFHVVRYHAAALILAGAVWPRLGLLSAGVALAVAWVDFRRRRPALPFPAFLAYYLAEHLAYGAGVLWGCVRHRTFRTYRPLVVREW